LRRGTGRQLPGDRQQRAVFFVTALAYSLRIALSVRETSRLTPPTPTRLAKKLGGPRWWTGTGFFFKPFWAPPGFSSPSLPKPRPGSGLAFPEGRAIRPPVKNRRARRFSAPDLFFFFDAGASALVDWAPPRPARGESRPGVSTWVVFPDPDGNALLLCGRLATWARTPPEPLRFRGRLKYHWFAVGRSGRP